MNLDIQKLQNILGALHIQIMVLESNVEALTKERDELKKQLEPKVNEPAQ